METNDMLFYFNKTAFETNYEQSIDTEFSLPDYYPEISKVLKCLTDVKILSKQIKESSIVIGGQAAINLIYADSEGRINSFEHICPFTKSIDAICNNDAYICARTLDNYINTKATGPRRVELHGAVNISVSVKEREALPLASSLDEDCVFFKTNKMITSIPEKTICKTVVIEDEIVAEPNMPVEKIIRSSAGVKITECKFLSGKMVIKGEADVSVIYLCSNSTKPIIKSEQRVFSQIIDIDSAVDNLMCSSKAKVLTLELRPKTSLDGDVKSINFEIKSEIVVFPYYEKEIEFNVDAFSSKCCCDLKMRQIDVERFHEAVNEKFLCSKTLDFSDGSVLEIFDLWCKPTIDYSGIENNEVIIKGTVNVNIIAIDSEDMPIFLEKSIDYEYRYILDENDCIIKWLPNVDITAINFNLLSDGSIDINVELSVDFILFTSHKLDIVSCINFDENNKILLDENVAVVMFFADNESVWDIAKRYSVSPDLICKANGIASIEDKISRVVLVPNIISE